MGDELLFAGSALLLICALAVVMTIIWVLCKVISALIVDIRDVVKYWIWQVKHKLPKDDWRDWK